MGIFGWSMPAGAWDSVLPGEEPEYEPCHRSHCGAFIKDIPDSHDPDGWEDSYIDENGKKQIIFAGSIALTECKNCGKISKNYE